MATITWKAFRTMATGGSSSCGNASRPWMRASGSWWARSDRPVRHFQAEVDPPVDVDAADGQRCATPGLVEALDSGELHRLALGQETGGPVADADLDRGHHRRHGEGYEEPEPVVAVAAPPEPPGGVHRRHAEAGHHEGGQDHVGGLHRRGGVEHRRPGIGIDHIPGRVEPEAGGLVHPGVGRHHEPGRGHAGHHDRDAGQEVDPGGEAIPPVEVEPDEDRLDEEGDALHREGQADDLAEAAHEPGPEDAEFERQDRARHRPDGEEDAERLGPGPGQSRVDRIAGAEKPPFGQQDDQRKADPEARQDDVPPQGQGHLGPGGQEVGHPPATLLVVPADARKTSQPIRCCTSQSRAAAEDTSKSGPV